MRRGEREARKARLHADLRLISGGGGGYLGYLFLSIDLSSFFSPREQRLETLFFYFFSIIKDSIRGKI